MTEVEVSVSSLLPGIVSDGNHLWVTDQRGWVQKVDTQTGAVLATVRLDGMPWAAAFDGTHVWVTDWNSNDIWKIEPESATVDATLDLWTAVSDSYGASGLSFDGEHMWVVVAQGTGEVVKLDPLSGQAEATARVGAIPTDVVSNGTHVAVANESGESVTILDAATATELATVELPPGSAPTSAEFHGNYLWVGNSNWGGRYADMVWKIDPVMQAVAATVGGTVDGTGLASDGTHIWVANVQCGSISRIDPETAAVEQIQPDKRVAGGIAYAGGDLWLVLDEGQLAEVTVP